MIAVLQLDQRPDRPRHGEDAHLDLDLDDGGNVHLEFELKSAATGKDYGTGRDTGIPQLRRWAGMHFAFAWFAPRDNKVQRIWYGSPAMMAQWNQAQQDYLAPDLALLHAVPDLVDQGTVAAVLGVKEEYAYEDLRRLLKDQWNRSDALGRANLYLENADVHRATMAAQCRYSPQMALTAVRDRVEYLLARGGTVNNRKIPRGYVQEHCVEITGPRWGVDLEQAVRRALAEAKIEEAGAASAIRAESPPAT